MRLSAPAITDDPLPMSLPMASAPSGTLLDPDAVVHFDALLHELYPDAVRVDRDRVLGLCGWLASMPVPAAQDVLARRLCRLEELRAMLDDPDWDAAEAMRARVSQLVAYADQVDDLIPDREPLLGKLDDVLLLELAWPAFAAEAEDYRDFCAYRDEALPCGNGGERRAAWIRDRLAEAALWQHHLRVNDSHYTRRGRAEAPFHVGG